MTSQSHLIRSTERNLILESDSVARYQGMLTTKWNLNRIPNGGYTLATALNCAQHFVERKRGKANADLLLASTSYFSKAIPDLSYTVQVRILKSGNGTTSVESDLSQPDRSGNLQLKLRVQALFANFDVLRADRRTAKRFTIRGDDSALAKYPFLTDPGHIESLRLAWLKSPSYPIVKVDEKAAQAALEEGRFASPTYMYMREEEVEEEHVGRYNVTAMAMYCDMTARPWMLMPESMLKAQGDIFDFWFPTMSMTIEMREPMPAFALQRVASIARTRHLSEGQWRFEVEVWSHPDDAERFDLNEDTKSVLLAVSHQTAMIFARSDVQASEPSKL